MYVAIVASLVGLVVVLVAYYRDPPLRPHRLQPQDWDVLPMPADIARIEFPMAFPGYDPATVEHHFDLLTRAYSDLLAAAPPEVIARARQKAALRQNIDLGPVSVPVAEVPPADETSLTPLVREGPDLEALRAEAALSDLDDQRPTPGY